jgi:hypothetical protein
MLTVTRACRFVFGQPIRLVKALALPFVLWLLLLWLVAPLIAEAFHAVWSPPDGESGESVGLGEIAVRKAAFAVIMAIAQTLFAVAWHRFVLLGPASGGPRPIPPWRRRHWRFLGYLLLLEFVFYVPTDRLLLFSISPYVHFQINLWVILGTYLWSLAVLYLAARLSLVLPARAIDRGLTLRQSWYRTQGQGLRLLVATALSTVPILPFVVLLVWSDTLVGSIFGSVKIGYSLMMLTNFVSTALAVTVLSLAFRHCTGWRPPSEAGGRGSEGGA